MHAPSETTVLITGSTDGIGRETARQLAMRGARVIVHGRSADKAARAADLLRQETGASSIDSIGFDLASLAAVREGAAEILRRFPKLHVLLHNAGVYEQERHLSADGFERTFAVNHLAPFLLTRLLLPRLEASAPARIVVVASVAHQRGQIHFDDLDGARELTGYAAYAQSKLANLLFVEALARRLDPRRVTVNALHPGVVGTKLLRQGFGMEGSESLAEGAATSVFLALAPDVQAVTGGYFVRCLQATPSALAEDFELAEALWAKSEAWVAAFAGPLPG